MSTRGDEDAAATADTPAPAVVTAPRVRPLSGRDEAVDHERQAGVPPPASDDYDDILDIEGAESFPASDPPSGW